MAERAEGSVLIEGTAADVMEVIADYESYAEWAGVESVEVIARGPDGRGTEVAFEVELPVLGRAAYTLSYRYAPGDTGLSWTTSEARGAVRDIWGEYLVTEVDERNTKVTYRLSVDLGVLVPGLLRTQGAQRVISTALEGLKRRVERG